MKYDIAKECADSLRSFTENHLGVQLKSSHAHELFAAYMGYPSRAALIADTKFPITNLSQAEFIVLQPTAFIKDRCKQLNGLPEEIMDGLTEGLDSPMLLEKWFLHKILPTMEYLALTLANEGMILRGMYFKDQKIQREGVTVEPYKEGVCLRVSREYVSPRRLLSGQQGMRCVVDLIKLKRVAGNVGYTKTGHHWADAETLEAANEKLDNSGGQPLIAKKPDVSEIEIRQKIEPSFSEWLAKHINRNSPLGDLATKRGFTNKDEGWPSYDNLEAYKTHLSLGNPPRGATATLESAWKTFNKFLKRKVSPNHNSQVVRPILKKGDSRKIVFVKNAIPVDYSKRTIEKFIPGDLAWISWDGRKAIPVTILESDDRHYTFRVERPLKKAGDQLFLLLDEVRSTPELACMNPA